MEADKPKLVKMLQPVGNKKIPVHVPEKDVEKMKQVGFTLAPKPKKKTDK
jgi:hypothetical protein